jgi:hypothetical protein
MAILVVAYLALYLVVVVGLSWGTVPVYVCLSLVKDFLPRPLKVMANASAPGAHK